MAPGGATASMPLFPTSFVFTRNVLLCRRLGAHSSVYCLIRISPLLLGGIEVVVFTISVSMPFTSLAEKKENILTRKLKLVVFPPLRPKVLSILFLVAFNFNPFEFSIL